MIRSNRTTLVTPTKAGPQSRPWLEQGAPLLARPWVPAFAGRTISFGRVEQQPSLLRDEQGLMPPVRGASRAINQPSTISWHDVHMLDQYSLTLRHADQARPDFVEISDELDFIKSQLARLPTRKEIARTTLLAMTSGAALTILLALAFWH
jgi:hypothetical protein